jgi:ATP/maltotriose-dependent transcriptional regulator MalT
MASKPLARFCKRNPTPPSSCSACTRRHSGPLIPRGRRPRLRSQNANDLDLAKAIKSVAAGQSVLDPQVQRSEALKGEREAGLTARELEVLQHIVAGKSNKEIS